MCNTHFDNVYYILISPKSEKLYLYHDGTDNYWELVLNDLFERPEDADDMKTPVKFDKDEYVSESQSE